MGPYKNEELIHAWIADMDFVSTTTNSSCFLRNVSSIPIFGYTLPPEILAILFVTGQKNSTTGILKRVDCL